ncbi:MAG: hypothetical protein E7673_03555 [Ruminococcaceae bacterium]|nr:hypothetical protein [Oscillospiraceae bacterium]
MRIDYFVFGYKIFHIEEEKRADAANALLKRNLSARLRSNGDLLVSSLKAKRYVKALAMANPTVSQIKGLPAFFLKYRERKGVILGIMLSIVYILFACCFVWDIRIEGNENISKALLKEELAENGLSVGAPWRKTSLSKLESEILSKSDRVGWISITRRGNVAYVNVREKNVRDDVLDVKNGYSNVVALTDCVIEEINVRRGIACVKAGDTVKAGELLISGVIPAELGGGFVRADGDVFGIVSERISLSVAQEEQKAVYQEEKLREMSVKIFNFSIKLFKKYGKTTNECAIIEDTKEFALFDKYRIPVVLKRVYVRKKAEKTVFRTEKEMISIASARLNTLRSYTFADSEMLKIKSFGKFENNSYVLTNDLTLIKEIGEERFFSDEP